MSQRTCVHILGKVLCLAAVLVVVFVERDEDEDESSNSLLRSEPIATAEDGARSSDGYGKRSAEDSAHVLWADGGRGWNTVTPPDPDEKGDASNKAAANAAADKRAALKKAAKEEDEDEATANAAAASGAALKNAAEEEDEDEAAANAAADKRAALKKAAEEQRIKDEVDEAFTKSGVTMSEGMKKVCNVDTEDTEVALEEIERCVHRLRQIKEQTMETGQQSWRSNNEYVSKLANLQHHLTELSREEPFEVAFAVDQKQMYDALSARLKGIKKEIGQFEPED
jgi:hypothetical protein